MLPRSLLIVLTFVLSSSVRAEAPATATPPARVEPAPLFQRSDLEALELSKNLPRQTRQLTGAEEKFLAFWQPASTDTPKGAVIILPGAGETADWPDIIGPLRRGLPDHGWSTMAVTLPDPQPAALPAIYSPQLPDIALPQPEPPPPASEPATPTEEPPAEQPEPAHEENTEEEKVAETTPAPEPQPPMAEATTPKEPPTYPERIDARIEAALAFARTQHLGALILLGHGTGGYWAVRHLAQGKSEEIRHLVMIDPSEPSDQELELEDLIGDLKTITGDFYYREGNAAQHAALRRAASRRAKQTTYTQIVISASTGDPTNTQEQLVRRVRGWLDRQITETKPARTH
ncbi:DUF3530 family protein [Azomonas macrocytogenes]|uniref:Putative esterase YcpF (UPF0227 family) n=1 Tax=Azomonas macrocytogenes TaxID=69962 RepID=A0A839SXJ5_AZOMA|nr:DUF3530 family protein [Azomonas macrocytogenes]MBB3102081.1 putative esterase YcpF (UPF0227 family) [Azomonas macrocytogenes]